MSDTNNLIIFLSDNHQRDYLGSAGHPIIKTPTLDRLSKRGTHFSHAYCASPLCCPSRAALSTGRYPHQTGYWDNALAYDGEVPTWHHRVRDAGHEVMAIGKLHFRSPEDDNGFSDEIDVMHILGGKGALITLMRATEEGMPRRKSHKAIYADSVEGEAEYQIYDRRITEHAIQWLQNRSDQDKPWVLLVSYPSPHPPFKVPQRFWDMYPLADVPLPIQWRPEHRPEHPAVEYLAWMNHLQEGFSEDFVRRVVAGYCGLITHVDEQIGLVMAEVERLGFMDNTRIIYTSDHGEAAGNHGILGKSNHYEHGLGVPLIMAGPDIPADTVIDNPVSHVDLFPTILEAMAVEPTDADRDLPGRSLWQDINTANDKIPERTVFTEFHAMGSKNSSFALRLGDYKLIYHVGMPRQLFNLADDPREEVDLLLNGKTHAKADELEALLREVVDPEAIDVKSKVDQVAHMEKFGGVEAIRKTGIFSRSPIPGAEVELEKV